ncbi:DgyrCDS3596 [Dimorphilus gyrociliatus]|uniref:DgyrCDS3596 n=1 Tax=Dimorphilus gyrociliatus TaxID=2664684 RepID=A0A7I8VEU5_9ANNE|nr:DgyrCDS3596 [Dimorphilus gyrociliatus]
MRILIVYFVLTLIVSAADEVQQIYLHFTIVENRPNNSQVGDIRSKIDDLRLSDQLRFNGQPYSDVIYDLVRVEPTTGIIRTKKKIDRESLPGCRRSAICNTGIFEVLIKDIRNVNLYNVKVNITISDENDEAPEFPQDRLELKVSEELPSKDVATLPTAVDNDSPTFGVRNYTLLHQSTSQSKPFKLSSVSQTSDLKLMLKDDFNLDRETAPFYKLTLWADDGLHRNKMDINIEVTDFNDNAPVFDAIPSAIKVKESVEQNSVIYKVRAQDKDTGDNRRITYAFDSETRQQYGHLFHIDDNTGEITNKKEIDKEKPYYTIRLGIIATDNGQPALSSTTAVFLEIMDVDDNKPDIIGERSFSILEEELDQSIEFTIQDQDLTAFTNFTCLVEKSSSSYDKVILEETFRNSGRNSVNYKLTFTEKVDREERPELAIRITCIENNADRTRNTISLKVKIEDKNDHEPKFSKNYYSTTLFENENPGNLITVTATDLDTGSNRKITYSIVEDDAQFWFQIDPFTGVIGVRYAFDYEAISDRNKKFTVMAKDGGQEPRSSTATVQITIKDKDDNDVQFITDTFHLKVYENRPNGTIVGSIIATDADSDEYNKFFYSLNNRNFLINSVTGEIVTRQTLDRESNERYVLEAFAESKDRNFRTTCSVIVTVGDENDNNPMWTFPVPGNNTLRISTDIKPDTAFGKVEAKDLDKDVNGTVSYRIKSEQYKGYIRINESSGYLYVVDDLTAFSNKLLKLSIEAKDEGQQSNVNETTLEIAVNRSTVKKDSKNLVIVIIVAVISALLAFALTIAIIFLCRTSPRTDNIKTPKSNVLTIDSAHFDGSYDKRQAPNYPGDDISFNSISNASDSGRGSNDDPDAVQNSPVKLSSVKEQSAIDNPGYTIFPEKLVRGRLYSNSPILNASGDSSMRKYNVRIPIAPPVSNSPILTESEESSIRKFNIRVPVYRTDSNDERSHSPSSVRAHRTESNSSKHSVHPHPHALAIHYTPAITNEKFTEDPIVQSIV